MSKTYIYMALAAFAALAMQSCDLEESQKSTASHSTIFSSETGLETYTNSFYNMLPNGSSGVQGDAMSDFSSKNSLSTYEIGAYNTNTATSWSWTDLRNINYFLVNNTDEAVPQATRDNYNGIAKLFRALFYYDKLVVYGDVPWYDKPIAADDQEALYAPRDSRDVIVRHMLKDLDDAYNTISASGVTTNSNRVNKWTALLLKSRIALFEASWQRYHANTEYTANCTIPTDSLYEVAAEAARTIMDNGPYKLHTGTKYSGGRGAYRDLFISEDPQTDEVMLAFSADAKLGMADINWWYNSSTYGSHLSMNRPFMKTYLNLDGTVYNEKNADGSYKNFVEETTNRDTRLNQTIRGADYTCRDKSGNYLPTLPNYRGLTLTGYQYTKYVMDDVAYDDHSSNTNDVPLMRYAEVLLNYAEARAELHKITDDDWARTIGALRRRAGITGGDLDHLPTKVDTYLQQTFYPQVTDPVILEIRRDRAIELCLEGFRMNDLKRWACGNDWKTVQWTGTYIPALNTPLDMNGDGQPDLYVSTDKDYKGEYTSIAMSATPVSELTGAGQSIQPAPNDPKGGYLLYYYEPAHTWNENMYLYPIPQMVITRNPNLSQNPGWK